MLIQEIKDTTPINIIKLPRHFKFFKNEFFTTNYKSTIIRLFRIKIESKKRVLGYKFIEFIKYEKPIYKYDRNSLYQEFKKLDIGTKNWYSIISSSARYFISNIDDMLFRHYYDKITRSNLSIIDSKYDLLYQFALDHNKSDWLTDDKKELKDSIFENNIVLGKQDIPMNFFDKYKRILEYAFESDESLLNSDKTDLNDDAMLKYILLDESIPTSTLEKIRRSCSRSYEYILDYAKCNIDYFKYFVTLTFADINNAKKYLELNENRFDKEHDLKFKYVNDPKNYDECIKKYSIFINHLKRDLKKLGIELYYLGVPEYQTIGNIHFHLLMSEIPENFLYDVPEWLDFDYETKQRRNGKGLINWKYGKSDIEKIKNKESVTSYLSGYLPKSVKNLSETDYLDRLNKQRFYKSNNLIKPIEKLNEDYNDEYEDIYYSNYINAFNQSNTEKIIFTLGGL